MFIKIKIFSLTLLLCMFGTLFSGCGNKVTDNTKNETPKTENILPVKSEKEIMAEKLIGSLSLTDEEKAKILDLSEKILEIKNENNEQRNKELDALNIELSSLLNKYTEEKIVPNEPDIEKIKKDMKSYKNAHDNKNMAIDSPVAQILDSCIYNLIDGERIERIKTNIVMPGYEEKPIRSNFVMPGFEEKSIETWENVKKILPKDSLKNINYLQTFSTGNNKDSVLGGGLSRHKNEKYVLWVNVSFDKKSLPYVLYHEYGHYLSLKADQSENENTWDYDQNYHESNFKEDSYMRKFYDKFYKYTYEDMQTDKDGYLFHLRHKNEFVSLYASSHLYDDFAESFACFIVNEATENGKEKMEFFEEFPELVKLKENICKMIDDNKLEAKKTTT